jgi:hypothetical protein
VKVDNIALGVRKGRQCCIGVREYLKVENRYTSAYKKLEGGEGKI